MVCVEFQTINQQMALHALARQPAAAGAAEEVVEDGPSQTSEEADVAEKDTGLGSLLSKFVSSKRSLPAPPGQAAPSAKRSATANAVGKQPSGGGQPAKAKPTRQPAKAKAKPGQSAKAAQLALPAASVEFWPRNLIEAAVSTWTEKSECVKVEIRTGQGKKSSAEVAAGDIMFMLEVTTALNTKVADMSGMPDSNEDDLAIFCREKCDTALFVGMFPVVVSCHSIGCCVFYFVCLGSSRCLQVVKFKFVPT